MHERYWQSILTKRISRRRALLATGGAGLGTLFLAACGGGSNVPASSQGSGSAVSGLLTPFDDTSKQAKPGGSFAFPNSRDPLHFDGQAQGQVQLNFFNSLAYEALVRNKMGVEQPSTWSDVESQLAQTWEFSPAGDQVTFKLRQGVKWQDRPPVGARDFDSSDVVASWNRYVTLPANNRASNANSVNPVAPIVSVTAPDAATVVVKLKSPTSYILQRFTSLTTGEVGSVYPRETGDSFDPKTDQIGTGAYMLDKFEPSVSLRYRKNLGYWDKSAAYFDTIEAPNLPEYSAGLSQFKSGGLSTFAVKALDELATKKDVPALSLYNYTAATNNPGAMMRFGWQPIDGKKSPFLDQRVRQALSMSFDRDTYIDTFFDVSNFQSQGVPLKTYWFTAQGYVPQWSLDPKGKDFGENSHYYQYNVAEAKKLLAAAQSAYGDDFPTIPSSRVNTVFGPTYAQQTDVMDQFATEIGLKVRANPLDYNRDYLTGYVTQQGQFSGMLYGIGAVSSADVTDYYVWRFYSKSGVTSGALGFGGPDGGAGDRSGDPAVDTMIEKAMAEFDATKRMEIVHDLQRYLAKEAYGIAQPGMADTLLMAWPAISNWATYWNDSRTVQIGIPSLYTCWYDDTKPHQP